MSKLNSRWSLRLYSFKRWLTAQSLPRYGYDGINVDASIISRLFPHASWVAGYDTGGWPWSARDWALFPNAVRVHIVTFAGANEGDVLDVENGDATPSQTEGWIAMRKAAGYYRPTIYCNASTVPAVRVGTGKWVLNVDYDLWVAEWTGRPFQFFSGGKACAATQYASTSDADYDVAYDPAWPHRTAPAPVPPPVKDVKVPLVVGEDITKARAVLTKLGLKVSIAREWPFPPGTQITSQFPAPGNSVPVGSTVVLVGKPFPPKPAPTPTPVPAPSQPLKRVVAHGQVSLQEASSFYDVQEKDIIIATLANCTPAEQNAFASYLVKALQGSGKPAFKMPNGLVYWVPAHTGKH